MRVGKRIAPVIVSMTAPTAVNLVNQSWLKLIVVVTIKAGHSKTDNIFVTGIPPDDVTAARSTPLLAANVTVVTPAGENQEKPIALKITPGNVTTATTPG